MAGKVPDSIVLRNSAVDHFLHEVYNLCFESNMIGMLKECRKENASSEVVVMHTYVQPISLMMSDSCL